MTRMSWQQKWQKNSSVTAIEVTKWKEKLDYNSYSPKETY